METLLYLLSAVTNVFMSLNGLSDCFAEGTVHNIITSGYSSNVVISCCLVALIVSGHEHSTHAQFLTPVKTYHSNIMFFCNDTD